MNQIQKILNQKSLTKTFVYVKIIRQAKFMLAEEDIDVIFIGLLLFLIVNTGMVLWRLLKSACHKINKTAYIISFVASVLAILFFFTFCRKPDSQIMRILVKLGHYGTGLFVYTVIFVNLTALLLFIGKAVRLIKPLNIKCVNFIALIICLVFITGSFGYGIIHAKSLKTKEYTIVTDKNTTGDFKIVLISDLHLGYMIDEAYIEKVVTKINKLNPDIVCIAGDIFDGDIGAVKNPEAVTSVFQSINARYGVYACLGNHDAGDNYDEMLSFLTDAGINVLFDEYKIIDNRIVLAGRRDSSPIGFSGEQRVKTPKLPQTDLPVVVLDHQPGNIAEYDSADLVLCGHTHKGQLFPFNFITNAMFDVDYGYYRKSADSAQVIVTSGVGTWGPPMRVGTDSEIVEITLK